MKISRFLPVVFLSCGLFAASAFATDSSIKIYKNTTSKTFNTDVIFYDSYTENTAGEVYCGSTTTSGGSSTFSSGAVNVEDCYGPFDFAVRLAPTTAGSVTVSFFGVFGTTTVGAGSGTVGVALLRPDDSPSVDFTNPYTFASTTATSTTLRFRDNPNVIIVGIDVTSGTMTSSITMSNKIPR